MEQAATYKYSEGDINSTKQFAKAAVLMCVRVGERINHNDVSCTNFEEEDLMNQDKSVTDVNTQSIEGKEGKKKRPQQSPFAKGGTQQNIEDVVEAHDAGGIA